MVARGVSDLTVLVELSGIDIAYSDRWLSKRLGPTDPSARIMWIIIISDGQVDTNIWGINQD